LTTLVTGATGFLGSHLVDLLLERGERPRTLVRPGESTNGLADGADVHWADVRDRDALAAAVEGVERVLHCAARTGPWGPETEYENVNVRALETLVEVAVAAGVRRLVHVSSVTVHGNDMRGEADETAPLHVESNPYSRSKVAGERLLARMIEDRSAPVTIVRPGWIYGPRDSASFGRFATMIRAGRMVMIGSGRNHVPLIYVRDAAEGVLLASEVEAALGRSYLLVNDEPVTQRDYLSAIAAELGAPPPTSRIPYRLGLMLGLLAEGGGRLARRPEAPPLTRYGVKLLGGENTFLIDRARQELGFSPRVGLAEGVRRSAEWFLTAFVPSGDGARPR
jgi:nucleoside-diphosphate-sugar epimerase